MTSNHWHNYGYLSGFDFQVACHDVTNWAGTFACKKMGLRTSPLPESVLHATFIAGIFSAPKSTKKHSNIWFGLGGCSPTEPGLYTDRRGQVPFPSVPFVVGICCGQP